MWCSCWKMRKQKNWSKVRRAVTISGWLAWMEPFRKMRNQDTQRITSTFVWQAADQRVCLQICRATELYVWLCTLCDCVHVCLGSADRWCDYTDMCRTAFLTPGPLAHTPLVWLPWAPCIMQQARDSTLHVNVHACAGCVLYVTTRGESVAWLLGLTMHVFASVCEGSCVCMSPLTPTPLYRSLSHLHAGELQKINQNAQKYWKKE